MIFWSLSIYCFFDFFPLVPLWNNENKNCLNELKFWEASENHKSSICWKFQLSISCGTQKSAKIPQPVAKMIWSFLEIDSGFVDSGLGVWSYEQVRYNRHYSCEKISTELVEAIKLSHFKKSISTCDTLYFFLTILAPIWV